MLEQSVFCIINFNVSATITMYLIGFLKYAQVGKLILIQFFHCYKGWAFEEISFINHREN